MPLHADPTTLERPEDAIPHEEAIEDVYKHAAWGFASLGSLTGMTVGKDAQLLQNWEHKRA